VSEKSILQLEKLQKIYRGSHLGKVQTTVGIQSVDLEIFNGEIFGLLGLNGAGKTTTLKLILGLLKPSGGKIDLFGQPLPSLEATQRLGYLPEMPYFPQYLTAEEILHFYGTLSNVPANELKDRSEHILSAVKMLPNKDKRIKECSKGMLQRISFAQALIHDPDLLILDEPITGLDPLGLSEMREMIVGLNSKGKTILFSSHIISEVEKIAHRVGILVDGKLVKILNADEWSERPGRLEEIFVETVCNDGEPGVR